MSHVFLCLQTSNSIGFGKETERSMIMSKSVTPDIPSSHESLIKWAYEHKYSPVTSYTKAPVANRFHLQLEDTGKLKDGVLLYRKKPFAVLPGVWCFEISFLSFKDLLLGVVLLSPLIVICVGNTSNCWFKNNSKKSVASRSGNSREIVLCPEVLVELNAYSLFSSEAWPCSVLAGKRGLQWLDILLVNKFSFDFYQKYEHISLRQLNELLNCLQTKLAYQKSMSKWNKYNH